MKIAPLQQQETMLGHVKRELSRVNRELNEFSGAMEAVRSATQEIAEEEGGPVLDHTTDFEAASALQPLGM